MPRKASISREQIVDAAVKLVRSQGHDSLTARALAKRMGCSTQPVLYCFASMDELVRATYEHADDLHSQAMLAGLEQAEDPLLQLGLNYVHFAQAEPQLFRFLFQTNNFGTQSMEQLLDSPELEPLLQVVGASADLAPEQARQVFLTLFACAHGLASMLANNALSLDDEDAVRILTSAFVGAMASAKGETHDESAG